MSIGRETPDTTHIWDRQYTELLDKQRWFPAEELLGFIGQHYTTRPGKEITGIPHAKVLDLGCGTGNNMGFLMGLGFHVTGYDQSRDALRIVNENILQQNTLGLTVQGSIQDLLTLEHPTRQVIGTQYDGVVDIRTSQHLTWSDHTRLYHYLADILSPGGWYFCVHLDNQTYDSSHSNGRYIDMFTIDNNTSLDTIFPNCGVMCMPPSPQLTEQMARAGLRIRSQETIRRSYFGQRKWASYAVIAAEKV